MKPMGVCEVVCMRYHWLKRPKSVKQEKEAKTRKLIVQIPQNIFSAPMEKNLEHPFVVFDITTLETEIPVNTVLEIC